MEYYIIGLLIVATTWFLARAPLSALKERIKYAEMERDRLNAELNLAKAKPDVVVQKPELEPVYQAIGKISDQLVPMDRERFQANQNIIRQIETIAKPTAMISGVWGEMTLRRTVELAGMVNNVDFVEQETNGPVRPDVVVKLPGNRRIAVDAKAPWQADKIIDHVENLSAKAYWAHIQPSPEFVVMFLPNESLLAEAVRLDPSLVEKAAAKKVLLATPTSLMAMLKAAEAGWTQESLSKNSAEIATLGRQVHDRLSAFAEHLAKVGRGLETAVKNYNSAVGTFDGTLVPNARRLAELGAVGSKELASPSCVETGTRTVN